MEEQAKAYFKPPAKLLVIDDSHLNRSFILNAFLAPNYEVSSAVDAAEGIEKAIKEQPELILLDIMMPVMDGFEAAKILKSSPETKEIPIIFITALDAIQDKLKAFEAGAVDFVTKPFNHKELMARVKTHIELRRSVGQKEKMLTIAMEEKRNASIARIAAGVSHNFNNMLGVSFGNIMFVESMIGRNLDPVAREALTDVRKSLERMQALVKQFLILANRSSEAKGKPQPTILDMQEMVDDAVSSLSSLKANSSSPVDVKCGNHIPKGMEVYCDSGHIREAIYLILNELVDTTAGRSECVVEPCPTPEGAPAGFISFSISIKGLVLPKDMAGSIFEPFALPIANVGAGLSFSVAKHLIESNGGLISSEFLQSGGLKFVLSFPAKGPEGQKP